MYPALRAEIDSRFSAMASFFNATKGFTGDDEMAAKGLMFVQAYAVYEYTVCSVVQIAIDALKSHNHRLREVSPSLLTLFLDPELSSLRDVGGKSVWDRRLQLFERAFSKDRVDISAGTGVPHDGSHFRYTQLEMIFRVFGINRLPVPRRAHIPRINEAVGHRNQIAHGSETAVDVGRRYTRSEIGHIMSQMKSVCVLQVTIFESYCSKKSRHRR
jgi:hypothetical protein